MAKNTTRQTTPRVAIVGLGYVGLPLAAAFARSGLAVLGFDHDKKKVDAINAGRSYIKHIPAAEVAALLAHGGRATSDPAHLAEADAILVCVPTPLTKNRDPDMSHVESAADMLAGVLRKGQLVCLESTTYPGTTREIVLPRLEKSGLKGGRDFHLAYSPEREDPGTRGHSANAIPKVVGGLTPGCLALARALYDRVVPRTVPVSSLETAEATKLMENIFRCVNIALVNELKVVFARMGLDIWEVVDAASTTPFGYRPFQPGPGLGGHCIPIDPFYLAWKAREYESATRFIELAGEVNLAMPEYVVGRTVEELNRDRKA
jgi:UDP-N-acetyl-D-glucosamine dehydrogenase